MGRWYGPMGMAAALTGQIMNWFVLKFPDNNVMWKMQSATVTFKSRPVRVAAISDGLQPIDT